MKQGAIAFAVILFGIFPGSAGAQESLKNPLIVASAASASVTATGAPAAAALLAAPETAASTARSAPGLSASALPARAGLADPQIGVVGVFENFNWQAYIGYTFFRFYEVPGITRSTNGFNYSIVYYPRGRVIGADGEFVLTRGSQSGVSSKFLLGMGGPRFRWSAPRGLEVWGHALVGASHFYPQTQFGSQNAFAYEAGGGVDISAHHRRIAYRFQGDMVGTRFFGTYQYSPKLSAGIVFKF